jgi:hypothetical protein
MKAVVDQIVDETYEGLTIPQMLPARFCPQVSCLRALRARFQELENFLVLFRSEVGAHAHVHRRYFPLGGA